MSTPSIVMRPEVGASRPAISPSSVDFPLPDGPTIATNSPRATSSVSGWRMVNGSLPLMTVLETSRRLITCRLALALSDDRLQNRPHVVRDHSRAVSRGMNAVALIERLAAGDAGEQEWNERNVVLARERRIHPAELHGVIAAEIRRRLHSGEHDPDAARLRPFDDRRDIVI